ncbi:hypothetical protein Aduo_011192 [Ancylostoma duodenale]
MSPSTDCCRCGSSTNT